VAATALLSIFTTHALHGAELASAEALPAERPVSDSDRAHWAFQPLSAAPVPTPRDPAWNHHFVDRYIKSALETDSLQPLPTVGRATWLRRVTFDLTGLPPTPDEIAQFLADTNPHAYEQIVDRLLASPAYGQRMARHWLDLARFAETDGFEHDLLRPHAWRYRDWVIDAFNQDLPFDRFVTLQLAGDLVNPSDPSAAIATGFLLCGPDMPDLNLQEERRHLVLNEITSTVGAVFLGLQIGCAQCHDHKFDPLSQQDFYRLRAHFESLDIFREHPIPTPEQLAARHAAESAWSPDDRALPKRRTELENLARKRFRDINPDEQPSLEQALALLSEQERQEHADIVARLAKLPAWPDLPLGRVVREGKPQSGHLYLRGDFRRPGPELSSAVPTVLQSSSLTESLGDSSIPPRVALAQWVTGNDQPLVARVIANRVWQWHFGVGLSDTPSDFGNMGSEPTHPELLDALARQLQQQAWSLKGLQRMLVLSQTYRLASSPYDPEWSEAETIAAHLRWQALAQTDPDNRRLGRRRARRLDGESFRDALLLMTGQLSPRTGGPGVRPPLPPEVTSTLLKDQWRVSPDPVDHRRRSIDLFVRRNLRYPLFEVFDRPDPNASCPARHESTTATQSLTLFNSSFTQEMAQSLAGRLWQVQPTGAVARLDLLYLTVLGRPALSAERQSALAFLAAQQELLLRESRAADTLALPTGLGDDIPGHAAAAWVDLCLALFNSSDFLYVD
jgi:hypothetical protein